MLNTVQLVGRLARDPEIRTTTEGKSVCTFTLMVEKRLKPVSGASHHAIPCVAYNRDAQYMADYMTKGRLIVVEGQIVSREVQMADGKRDILEVVADRVRGLDRPKDEARADEPGLVQAHG